MSLAGEAGVTDDDANLELPTDVMRAMSEAVTTRCIDHIASLDRQPACGDLQAADLCRSLQEPCPEAPAPLAPILDQLFDDWIPRSFNTAGPGYLAYIPGGGLFPAALADFISNTTNRYTGIWTAAPVLVQLEANALDWLRDWMGFPDTTRGLFTVGGSLCGASKLRAALTEKRALALDIASRVGALPGIVMVAPPQLSLFAFHLDWPGATREEQNDATRELLRRVNDRQRVMITGCQVDDRFLARVCVLSFRTRRDHAAVCSAHIAEEAERILDVRRI